MISFVTRSSATDSVTDVADVADVTDVTVHFCWTYNRRCR